MSKIQTGRYEQFTRRLLRLVGGSIMPLIQNDLSPVINIEDPADIGLLFWKGHRLASGTDSGTSDAAEFEVISLFNPLGSGKIINVLAMRCFLASDASLTLSITQDRTANVSPNVFFADSRAAVAARPVGEVGEDSLAAAPTNTGWSWFSAGAGGEQINQPQFVLSPGFGLQVTHPTAQSFIGVSFYWLERTSEGPELESS